MMNSAKYVSPILFLIACLLPACSKETGKYQTGKDDPSLKATDKDLAQVNKTLDKQEAADRAKGLRKNAPPLPPMMRNETGMNLPPGHPPFENMPLTPPRPPGAGSAMGTTTEGPIAIGSLGGNLPAGWASQPPSNSMRIAEIRMPAVAGDKEDAVLAVTMAAGGVEANIQRWYGQFKQPDGRASKDAGHVDHLKAGNMDVTLLDLSGTMMPTGMPGGPTSPMTQWRMLGGIVESPGGTYFFKATGPENTIGENRDKMVKFLTGLKTK